ncbi:MAG: YdcF family protein [Pseudomonadales bacterium]
MLYRSLLKLWLLPPMLNILLVVVGLALLARFRRTGIALCATGLGSLLLFSLPVVSDGLLASTEVAAALSLSDPRLQTAAAIVVLGSAHRDDMREFGQPWPRQDGQARLNYAAWLHRQVGLPLMLTGGVPSDSDHAHALVSGDYLQTLHGIAARWFEQDSRTTSQNAEFAARMLLPEGIDTVVLVTQSMHMRRSILLFERAGFTVIAAPTELAERSESLWQASRWMPNTRALKDTTMVLHEMLGYYWYRLRM